MFRGGRSATVRGQRGYLVVCLRIVLVAAAYIVAAKLGLTLALVRGQVTPLWPPTGIGLACLLLMGIRALPGIPLGAFAVNISLGPSLPVVLGITAGNTLAPLCAYLLLNRVGFRQELDRLRDAVALVFIGALGGMLVSATFGVGTLFVAGALPASGFWASWSVWWTGDAMGVLVITPTLLVASRVRWRWQRPTLRWLEAAILLTCELGVVIVAGKTNTPLFFLAFPLLTWAALRFQLRGSAPCALIIASAAAIGASHGSGPFMDLSLLQKMIVLQVFNASIALTALMLAAIISQRNDAMRAVERAVGQLTDAVATLEPYRLLRGGVLDGELRTRFGNGVEKQRSPDVG
jgi:integral membrane sensor domain MASE1